MDIQNTRSLWITPEMTHPSILPIESLSDHPELQWLTPLSKVTAELDTADAARLTGAALVESIAQNGILTPLIITHRTDGQPGWWVVDGRTRREICSRLLLSTVPVQYVNANEVTAVVCDSMSRREWSVGARAWIALEKEGSLLRRPGRVVYATDSIGSIKTSLSRAELAMRWGTTEASLELALTLRKELTEWGAELAQRVVPALPEGVSALAIQGHTALVAELESEREVMEHLRQRVHLQALEGVGLMRLYEGVRAVRVGHTAPGTPRPAAPSCSVGKKFDGLFFQSRWTPEARAEALDSVRQRLLSSNPQRREAIIAMANDLAATLLTAAAELTTQREGK
jgi:ParB-like nuclease domain